MKRVAVIIGFAALVLVGVAAASVQTQQGQMTTGHYDQKAEVTIKGTVEKTEKLGTEHMIRIRLIVKTAANETFAVHLGPAWFVEKTMTFREGDAVEVTGSKMPAMGVTFIMAREVKKGEALLKLRDGNGMPVWSRMHMPGPHS